MTQFMDWLARDIHRTKDELEHELNHMMRTHDLKSWVSVLVTFANQSNGLAVKRLVSFGDEELVQLKTGLEFILNPTFINLTNALFFYKLHPDLLFNESIRPEKLVSICLRLGLLHEYMERMHTQYYQMAYQCGLTVGVDLLFHGNNLPEGIRIKVDEEAKAIIQKAVKNLKNIGVTESEDQVLSGLLEDLKGAYKFSFKPKRLIDAAMVLQQRIPNAHGLNQFQQAMVRLYQQVSTSECLNLYGYFANEDSSYLLCTLQYLRQGLSLDSLPALAATEKSIIEKVFQSVQCVMEALREELKNRHVITAPYVYDLANSELKVTRRNREAVAHLLATYSDNTSPLGDKIEQLFRIVEE